MKNFLSASLEARKKVPPMKRETWIRKPRLFCVAQRDQWPTDDATLWIGSDASIWERKGQALTLLGDNDEASRVEYFCEVAE
ncbi:MAG: hypothetical protein GX589_01395 [Deltaproteobacteria bacterium]|nr:hypothetical protein [Deltaproteobacteria bacterium]